MFLDDMTYRRVLKYDGDPRALGYGRFLQPDPIGYDDGLNWYDYTGGDPVNGSDPSGLDHSSSRLPCASNETFAGFDHGGRAICNPYVIGPDIIATGPRQPPVVITGSLTVTPGPSSGYPAAIMSYPSTPQSPYRRTSVIPKNALRCSSGGVSFYAPPSFSTSDIATIGSEGGLSDAGRAVGQGGAFDFQRSGTIFISAYTNASNFAVGAYLGGAGYSKFAASAISNTYAFFNSSNGATAAQATYRNAGIDAANGTLVTCKPAF